MTRLILGGVTLAALGYGLKKYKENGNGYRIVTDFSNEQNKQEENNYFKILYDTKIDFFENIIVKYEQKLNNIKELPAEATIKNASIAFAVEVYDESLPMYDAANLLALELKEDIASASNLLEKYLPKTDIFANKSFSFIYSSNEDRKTLTYAIELINDITEIADINILNKDSQINTKFIEVSNSLKSSLHKMEKQLKKLEDTHYAEFSEIVVHNQNEKPIGFEFVYDLLLSGDKHTLFSSTIESRDALMVSAMYVVKEVKTLQSVKSLIVNFHIPHDMSLDTVDKALNRIRENIDKNIELHAGTKCSYEYSNSKIGVDVIVVN